MVGPSVQSKEDGGEEQNPGAVGKPKGPLAAREEEVLAFWDKEKIFEQSLAKPAPRGEYVFYDGPPFASGLPHYGHLLQSAIKDAIPRYRTMRGYRVARQWGWDCHGLPVENLVEKELNLKGGKKAIEEYGIEKFNDAARASIMKDVEAWRRIIPRIGRWVDMEHDYKTMDSGYTESVWWAFKSLYDRGLAYEGFKAMHYCPRCGTTLANFEVALGYKDIEDIAVTVRLPLADEPGTSLLVWTTTPWTLPGNTAAAVNQNFTYEKVRTSEGVVIAAQGKVAGEVLATVPGKELVGKRYLPPFDYFKDEIHKHKTHAWRVYHADYVTLESGTGIVHLAPAFGAEDLDLAQANKIPLIHHVTDDGRFVATVSDFAHLPVKPKGNHKETDQKVVENLRARGLLFAVETISHSYPHCWRCDTPLLNWAATSWFVNVQKIKAKLLAQNASVHWVPGHVGQGRFGKWLEGARDWAVSRSRYWGAPLPVWRHESTKEVRVAGSVLELLSLAKRSGNRYFVMRHGQARHNVDGIWDCYGQPDNHVTPEGRVKVRAAAAELKREQIDLIVVSPLVRTQETARIVAEELGLPASAIMTDERLREVDAGTWDGRPIAEWHKEFATTTEYFTKRVGGVETFTDIRKRTGELLFDVERRYTGKNILFVTHEGPGWLMHTVAKRMSVSDAAKDYHDEPGDYLNHAQVKELVFTPYPHNTDYELDLHRPYIDDFNTGEWKRVKDVFDCWFESGSMPFASRGYPRSTENFNPKRLFGFGSKGYPADFIAEALDQTRGWFYSLIVLGTALFNKTPYKNVITTGLVLAQDGQKMSKRLKNYPDPMEVVERYGADSLRYFMLASPVIRGEDLRFSERGVDEVGKKLLMRLDNVRSFYELYAPQEAGTKPTEKSPGGGVPNSRSEFWAKDFSKERFVQAHILDRWIFSRLEQLVAEVTEGFETYQLDMAARPLGAFIDDLSTWYVRRSRDRFKQDGPDKDAALATLRRVLIDTAKVMAPLMPFFADDLYRRLRIEGGPVSVHLTDWPESGGGPNAALVADMAAVRELASVGLKLREQAGLKVRQPLASLTAASVPEGEELRAILRDELNVKEIIEDPSVHAPALNTELTAELKEEGLYREWVRAIQDWRKGEGLSIADRPGLLISTPTDAAFLNKFKDALCQAANLLSLEVKEGDQQTLERL